jgi:hypothetical protein
MKFLNFLSSQQVGMNTLPIGQPFWSHPLFRATTSQRATRNSTRQAALICAVVLALFATCSARAETDVWFENFGDGNGNERWYAQDGVWQIGSPTLGPSINSLGYRAYSVDEYCATTGLNGNYPAYADSRLIRIASFVVPATNQYPRLRFWQWFSFAGAATGYPYYDPSGSYGYVEITEGTNDWQTVSPTYVLSGAGVWSRPSIDLTAYAGKTVQIAFHFHSESQTAVGWDIDDIALVTGTPVFNNPEGFESGEGDWSAESGTWEVGPPTSGPSPSSYNFNSVSGVGWIFGASSGIDANSGTFYSSSAPAPNGSPELLT